jgi:hypothetical protein
MLLSSSELTTEDLLTAWSTWEEVQAEPDLAELRKALELLEHAHERVIRAYLAVKRNAQDGK